MLHETELKDVSIKPANVLLMQTRDRLFPHYSTICFMAATTVSNAACNLESIIAIFAIYGCPTMKNPIIVMIVDFAGWAGRKTFSTAMIVACASTRASTRITTAKVASTNQTVPCVKNSSLVPEVRHMKCPVVMPFTGSAFGNWPLMTLGARYVKRRPRRRNG